MLVPGNPPTPPTEGLPPKSRLAEGVSSKRRTTARLRRRRLLFDTLEDRRVLAGIDLLVFQGPLGSLPSSSENGLAGVVAYLDLNRNGTHDTDEPTAVSNADGVASFRDVAPGSYVVALLGDPSATGQTYPVAPAIEGVWEVFASDLLREDLPILPVATNGDGQWLGRQGDLLLLSLNSKDADLVTEAFSGDIEEILLKDFTRERIAGVAKISHANLATLVEFEWTEDTGLVQIPIEGEAQHLHGLTLVGERLFAVDALSQQAVEFFVDSEQGLSLLAMPTDGEVVSLQPLAGNRIAMRETTSNGERLSVYRLDALELHLESERTFVEAIAAWRASSSGELVYVQVSDSVQLLDISSGLPTVSQLSNSRFPILDSKSNNTLYTPSLGNDQRWEMWDWTNGARQGDFEVPPELLPSEFLLNSANNAVTAVSPNGRYVHAVAQGLSPVVEVSEGTSVVTMGLGEMHIDDVRVEGASRYQSPKDSAAFIQVSDWLSSIEVNGKTASTEYAQSLHWVILEGPKRGELSWQSQEGGIYVPDNGFVGEDSFLVAAYNGRTLSNSFRVELRVFEEEPREGLSWTNDVIHPAISPFTFISEFSVDEERPGALYEFQVDDSRFGFLGSLLLYVQGGIPQVAFGTLPLLITAINRYDPSDKVQQLFNLKLEDPHASQVLPIVFSGNTEIPERKPGFALGTVGLGSLDTGLQYDWILSDNRFEVEGSTLKLRSDRQLWYADAPTIPLTISLYDVVNRVTISHSLMINVLRNFDPWISISTEPEFTLPETVKGGTLGTVSISSYGNVGEVAIQVSDERFEIVEGTLKVKNNQNIPWVAPGSFELTLTATASQLELVATTKVRIVVTRNENPYHNEANPADVDGDGQVTPLDPLLLVNYLNNNGPGVIDPEGEGAGFNLDVDGDGLVTPLDVLIVINHINTQNRLANPSVPVQPPVLPPDPYVQPPSVSPPPAGGMQGEGEGGMEQWLWSYWSSDADELLTGKKGTR